MSNVNLNLARKWRSRAFDQIVGQDLPIRMLKNSLYLESFFPVYLFSGTRGCGKTTMARVFASAINCQSLPDFQKNPKSSSVPCLTCFSCSAMLSGKHPDFIEIDAASRTGVDNVRQIIDAASLLPILGRKKIYLIDEAHMLSKAAFNAFLKILEEPPASVLFILATTDPQKIIDTVKSRCFQLFFTPVETQRLFDHLVNICKSEQIHFDPAGLQLVVKATQGSVRDAINLLEQVRFSTSNVTKSAVLNVLGHIEDERLLTLFELVLKKGPRTVLKYVQENKFECYSADFIWKQLVEIARAAVWAKYSVESTHFQEHAARLKNMVHNVSWEQLNCVLDTFYTNESLFLRTTAQHAFLEMILLKLAQKNPDDNSGSSSASQNAAISELFDEKNIIEDEDGIEEDEEDDEDEDDGDDIEESSGPSAWTLFVQSVGTLNDPLLNSIFRQGKFLQFDATTKTLDIEFSKELILFSGWLDATKKLWSPLLNKLFKEEIIFNPSFNGESKKIEIPKVEIAKATVLATPVTPHVAKNAPSQPTNNYKQQESNNKTFNRPFTPYTKKIAPKINNNPLIDTSNKELWKKANMLLQVFPGIIREIKESVHEQKS